MMMFCLKINCGYFSKNALKFLAGNKRLLPLPPRKGKQFWQVLGEDDKSVENRDWNTVSILIKKGVLIFNENSSLKY